MKGNKIHLVLLALGVLMFLMVPCLLLAGTTGKIAGYVKDKETGDPLPGANIIIEGTTMGAAADIHGYYFIINVPPGVYKLTATMMGYTKMTVENVRVVVDLTTEVNFELEAVVLVGKAITVTAERPLIEPEITTKRQTVTAEMIESMPVSNVRDIITVQSGIIEMQGYYNMVAGFSSRGIDQVHVRGGRPGQIAYMIDGMYVEDAIYSGMGTNINREAIKELTVITGNFDAEYGQAQAAVVNIVTKEGQTRYSGTLEYSTSEWAEDGYLGRKKIYSSPSKADDLRNYHNVIGSISGPIPFAKNVTFFLSGRQYYKKHTVLEFDHFTYDTTLIDDDFLRNPDNPTYRKLQEQINRGIIKDYSSVEEMKGKRVGDVLRHWATGAWRTAHKWDTVPGWRAFGFYTEHDLVGKLSWRLNPTMKLTLISRVQRRKFRDFNWNWQFAEYGRHVVDDRTDQQGFIWTHQPSLRTFYEVRVNRFWKYRTYRIHGKNGHILEPDEYRPPWLYNVGGFYGNLRFVRYDTLETGRIRHVYEGACTQFWTRNFQESIEVSATVTSQIHRHHLIKIGGEYKRFHILFDEQQHPYLTNPYIEYYDEHPVEASFFLQDLMEFERIIVRAGVRWDYANSGGGMWSDPADPTAKFTIGRSKYQISPRLGISYPITDKSYFHFSYGHFFQIPEYRNLYTATSRDPAILERRLATPRPLYGNPHLDAQRTVAYEIGIKQQIGDVWAVELTAWSRENSGEAGTVQIVGFDPQRIGLYSYYVFLNHDYGSARGIDVTLEKRFSHYCQFTLNYTYSVAKGNKYFSWAGYWDEDTEENKPKKEYLEPWDKPHVLDIYGLVNFPKDFGPSIGGVKPLEDFTLNFVVRLHSGYPYTPSVGGQPLEPNSGRRPWTFTIDMVVRKDITLFKNLKAGLFAEIHNLLDRKNPLYVYSETGSPTDPGPGMSKTATSTQYDRPHHFGPRRTIDLGLRLFF